MKYNVGDRVLIKSLDWYNENKDEFGVVDINDDFAFYADRSKYCGKVFTISKVFDNSYFVKEDNGDYYWSDEMIEGLVEEENKSELVPYFEEGTNKILYYKNKNTFECYFPMRTPEYICPEGYIFKDENGNVINATKIVLEKKKKEYPKTYEECCEVLDIDAYDLVLSIDYRSNKMKHNDWKRLEKLNALNQILICRDVYWKLAGEEMELNKPWEPDDNNKEPIHAITRYDGYIIKDESGGNDEVLEFPTEEMRDAFYENFKELIEICKELL